MKYLHVVFALLQFSLSAFSAEVSITIDDFALNAGGSKTLVERDQKMLDALSKHGIKAAVFVSCQHIEAPQVLKRLGIWDETNHLIANHTYSHWNYDKTDFKKFTDDVLKCDKMIDHFKHYTKLFRFPYLKGGNTKEKTEKIQNFLQEHDYKNGYVTIDASDWYVSDRFAKYLSKNPNGDVKKYRDYYLEHMWDRAQYYETLAKKHWKNNVKHTLLIHHNLINAYFLDDLLQMFKDKGWKLIDAKNAFKDPIFRAYPNIVPGGESVVWAIAKEAGDTTLRYPGEDSVYEKKRMAELGL